MKLIMGEIQLNTEIFLIIPSKLNIWKYISFIMFYGNIFKY